MFLLACKSRAGRIKRSRERHTGELAVYIDLAENAARDDGSVPERILSTGGKGEGQRTHLFTTASNVSTMSK